MFAVADVEFLKLGNSSCGHCCYCCDIQISATREIDERKKENLSVLDRFCFDLASSVFIPCQSGSDLLVADITLPTGLMSIEIPYASSLVNFVSQQGISQ